MLIERWRREYYRVRPHIALGYLAPEEFAVANFRGKDVLASRDSKTPPGFSLLRSHDNGEPILTFGVGPGAQAATFLLD